MFFEIDCATRQNEAAPEANFALRGRLGLAPYGWLHNFLMRYSFGVTPYFFLNSLKKVLSLE